MLIGNQALGACPLGKELSNLESASVPHRKILDDRQCYGPCGVVVATRKSGVDRAEGKRLRLGATWSERTRKDSMDVEAVIRAIDGLRFRKTKDSPETYPSAARQDRFKWNRKMGRKPDELSEKPIYVSDPFAVLLPKGRDASKGELGDLSGMVEGNNGTDALAFYRPFHFFDNESWGIFIKTIGIEYLVRRVFLRSQSQSQIRIVVDDMDEDKTPTNTLPSVDALRQVAFAFLFRHEYYHFLTEIAASALEVAMGSAGPPYYSRYSRDVYSNPQKNPDEPLEEALANAYAYRSFHAHSLAMRRLVPGYERNVELALKRFMGSQRGGYNSFGQFRGRSFVEGLSMLGTQICSGLPALTVSPPLELMFDWGPRSMFSHYVPVRFVL